MRFINSTTPSRPTSNASEPTADGLSEATEDQAAGVWSSPFRIDTPRGLRSRHGPGGVCAPQISVVSPETQPGFHVAGLLHAARARLDCAWAKSGKYNLPARGADGDVSTIADAFWAPVDRLDRRLRVRAARGVCRHGGDAVCDREREDRRLRDLPHGPRRRRASRPHPRPARELHDSLRDRRGREPGARACPSCPAVSPARAVASAAVRFLASI